MGEQSPVAEPPRIRSREHCWISVSDKVYSDPGSPLVLRDRDQSKRRGRHRTVRSQPARTRYRKASRASSNPWAPQPVGILLGPNAGCCCRAATTAENPARSLNTALYTTKGGSGASAHDLNGRLHMEMSKLLTSPRDHPLQPTFP